MIIIKAYLLSVLFWFLLIEITGIIFRKRFIRNTNILDKILEDKEPIPRESWIVTTLRYLVISFIPTLRVMVYITKLIITFKPKLIIEYKLKEREKQNVNDKKN